MRNVAMRLLALVGSVVLVVGGAAMAGTNSTEERFIQHFSVGEISYGWNTRADLAEVPGGSLQMQQANIRGTVPVFRTDRSSLTAGVSLRWNRLDFDGAPEFGETLNLYCLQVPFDFWHSFNDNWKFWGRLEPGLFTDFDSFDEDTFALTALALASYQFSPKLSLAFGVYYSRDLGEDRALPALGAIWKPNPRWNIALTYPRASIVHAPTTNWLFSVFATPGGAGWSIADAATGDSRRLNYRAWYAGAGAERRIAGVSPVNLWAFITGGFQFGQELQLRDGGDTLIETDMDNGAFLACGLRVRL